MSGAPAPVVGAGAPSLRAAVGEAVRAVPDPELAGLGIGDLGLVHEIVIDEASGAIEIALVPTFLGCPALGIIEADVGAAVGAVPGVTSVRVRFASAPVWTPDRISDAGRRHLAELGIAVATDGPRFVSVTCPVCGASHLRPVSDVGPTACRAVAWCESCRTPVEVVRR
jgi:ring-1,2-phenylacetyl-CoA epoxidase subunit PaaD